MIRAHGIALIVAAVFLTGPAPETAAAQKNQKPKSANGRTLPATARGASFVVW
jgi:hypothetical protein